MGPIRILLLRHLSSKFSLQPTKDPTFTTHLSSLLINRSFGAHQRRIGRPPDSQLYTRISLLGSSNTSVVPFLDQWVDQGQRINELEFRRIIRLLRARNRYDQALEVSEWMSTKKLCPFLSADQAVKLDLIGKVRGIDAAESYFKEMEEKSERFYGSLLNCYVREGLVEKSVSHFEAMKEMGIAKCCLSYNNIMTLYVNTGKPRKALDVLAEMKGKGVLPDEITYRICMKACGSIGDFEGMEGVLKEMECQPQIVMDSSAYSTMATFYMKAGLNDKALEYLKKAESLASRDPRSYRYLITMYTSLGKTSEVLRLWAMLKSPPFRLINVDYVNMLSSLVKLKEFAEAEKIFKDWESAGTLYDFRVPNVLLLGYTRRGLIDKAEKMLQGIIESGKTPIPNTWSIFTAGAIDMSDMKKAFEYMKKALAVAPQHRGWLPKPDHVSRILEWLGDEGDVSEVEAFVELLKKVVDVDKDMYRALIKANVRHGNEADAVLQRMKDDGIHEDDETKALLSSG